MRRWLLPVLAASGFVSIHAHAQTATTDTPKVVASTIRLENGIRASKIIGSPVYNAQNQHIGDVSDLYLSRQNQVAMAVVQVGGFLGIGGKLVAVPMNKLQLDQPEKLIMPDGSKAALQASPAAEYGG
jgi:sporulation protein YlmC with PRC-barrel domain